MSKQYKVLINSVRAPRKLVPYDNDFYRSTIDKIKNSKKEAYESLYIYNESHYNQLKETGSLAGIQDVVTDKVVFDFDSQTNPEEALADAKTLVGRILADGFSEEEILCAFSGNKGIHVEVALKGTVSRDEFESIIETYAGDLKTFDTSVKDQQRVFRLPFSFNTKSGLYKFPMSATTLLDESTTINEMKEYAANPSVEDGVEVLQSIKKADNKFKIKKKAEKKEQSTSLVASESTDFPDFSKNKTGLTNAKYALACGYFEEGERHEAVMILSSTYRALGWELENAYRNIKGTIAQRNRRLGIESWTEDQKEELWTEVSSVYNPTWKGGTYKEDSGLLKKVKERYKINSDTEGNPVVNLNQIDDIFSNFAENIDKNTLRLGIPSFDDHIRVTTSTLVGLLAAPSAGKSSIAFGILNSTSNDGIKSMFFSLDMAAPQVYQRLAQRHTGMHSDRIFKAYKNREKGVIADIKEKLAKEYANVKFCFRGAMNVELIRELILKEKEISGEFPKLVVIDYLENITTPLSSDPTIAKGYVARSLKDIANEFSICVLLLTQPAKIAGGPANELNSYTDIKGSSVVGEACAQVITMHRPGFNPKDTSNDTFLNLTVVKNRMGELGSFDYSWNGLTGAIREMTSEEEKELKTLRELKATEKLEVESNGGFKRFGSKRNGEAY